MTAPAPRPWSLRGRLVRRVVLAASLAWLVAVGLAALVIAHEMSELMDETLESAARFSLDLYAGAGDAGGLTRSAGTIRIVDAGTPVADAPWPPLPRDGGHDDGDAQYAPRRRKTAGMVLSRMERSSPTDQRSR